MAPRLQGVAKWVVIVGGWTAEFIMAAAKGIAIALGRLAAVLLVIKAVMLKIPLLGSLLIYLSAILGQAVQFIRAAVVYILYWLFVHALKKALPYILKSLPKVFIWALIHVPQYAFFTAGLVIDLLGILIPLVQSVVKYLYPVLVGLVRTIILKHLPVLLKEASKLVRSILAYVSGRLTVKVAVLAVLIPIIALSFNQLIYRYSSNALAASTQENHMLSD